MASQATLRELLTDEVRDLYDAEKQLVKALPKMAKAATSDDLREALEAHLAETETQVGRLEQVFELLGERARGKHCPGIAGIVEEGSELMSNESEFDGSVLDAGLIAGAQRVEHYEIAAYGSVLAWAKTLGMDDVITLLEPTLEEEKAADEKLSALAESSVNSAAASGEESDEEESEESEEEEDNMPGRTSRSGNGGRGRMSMAGSRGGNSNGRSRSGNGRSSGGGNSRSGSGGNRGRSGGRSKSR